jgi:predicted restriction endonuclease
MRTKTDKKKLEKELDDLWHQAVLKRDCYRCRICGSKDRLQTHHIFSRIRKTTRWDMDNGITLCAGHHYLAHRDPEKFRRFVIKIIGEEKYEELYQKSLYVAKITIKDLEIKREEFKQYINEGDSDGEES